MSTKIALVTGCSSGIGLATAVRLARDPDSRFVVIATVIAMSESSDLVSAVGDVLDKTIFIKPMDITIDENITEVVGDVIKTYGRVDILLNIAGVAFLGIPELLTRKQIDASFNVNTIGTIRLTQAVLPHMKKKRSGKIVTITSTSGKIGWPYSDVYCASKFALEGYFESLAAGLRAFDVSVCLIEPAGVQTGLKEMMCSQIRDHLEDESVDDIDRQQLFSSLDGVKACVVGTADEVAEAIIGRCLEVEKPVLRHMLAGKFTDEIGRAVADLTGEAAVRLSLTSITPSQ